MHRHAIGWARSRSRTAATTPVALCLCAICATLAYAYVCSDIIDDCLPGARAGALPHAAPWQSDRLRR